MGVLPGALRPAVRGCVRLLRPAFQAANPFSQWKAGFADTQSIEVETAAGRSPSEVLMRLTAMDSGRAAAS